MRQMILVSAGLHLFFFGCLLLLHYFKWNHPLIKPHVLSVQWVTLPAPHPEVKITAPQEPLKKIESLPVPRPQKKNKVLPQPHLKPEPRPVISLPPPVSSKKKEAQKVEAPPPPPVEAKKEEPAIPSEPQKIEIAPISSIDPTYVDRVKRTVDMNWNPPTFTGTPKEVTVSFEILKNGLIKNPKIVKSSRDSYFDMAALRAVFESRRFGQLPSDYPSLSVEITCTFSQNKGS